MDKTMGKKEITLEEIRNFKGKYPKQLWYLALVEMWERFTFYGMRALLALYIAHLALSADYKPLSQEEIETKKTEYQTKFHQDLTEQHPKFYLETSQQKWKDEAESKSNKQYGLIQAFIYAMAFAGGMFADRLFGFRKSVFWGGILMAVGTFTMAIPGAFTFYLGISILIVGNGFFKPNISTMVGALYKQDDPRRDAGFSVFYMAINVGALLSGAMIGYIGTAISWSLGFALSGICMLLGLGVFHFTQKKLGPIGLAPDVEKLKQKTLGISKDWLYHIGTLLFIPFFLLMIYYPVDVNVTWLLGEVINADGTKGANYVQFSDVFMITIAVVVLIYLTVLLFKVSKEEFGKMLVAIILILFCALFFSFFEQGGGSLNFFAAGNVDGHGLNMTQINNSVNSLWVIIFAPILGVLWIALSKKNREPNTIVKFGLGFVFLGLGFLVFYLSRALATSDGFTPLWTFVLAYLVISVGELCLSPIGLSMITQLTPVRLHGMMMGTWFLATAYGQYGAGLIGSMLAKVDTSIENPTNMDKLIQYTDGYQSIAYIAVGAGIVLLIISPFLNRVMSRKQVRI
ncbi:MAG: peptide MFS transporter [Flavobacteriaceae bacterium]|jgi:POT family proton-dependent oligopeptide transporter|nr:peptide MFS transporter [Flavobacteriaceae bacterium]